MLGGKFEGARFDETRRRGAWMMVANLLLASERATNGHGFGMTHCEHLPRKPRLGPLGTLHLRNGSGSGGFSFVLARKIRTGRKTVEGNMAL